MTTWNKILAEIADLGSSHDAVRRRHLAQLSEHTGRNTVLYYSGWLQEGHIQDADAPRFAIQDADKAAFMSVLQGLDPKLGLDLILHTPGGDLAATESICAYLREVFERDIRAIVPQIAMSGGTIMACACKAILMGPYSNIGPFDPQIGGSIPAHAITEEFARASAEIKESPGLAALWQPILSKYSVGLLSKAQRAVEMADEVVTAHLEANMLNGMTDVRERIDRIVGTLGSFADTKMHNRHIERSMARWLGLVIEDLDADPAMEEIVLSTHNAALLTLEQTRVIKLVENHRGEAAVSLATSTG